MNCSTPGCPVHHQLPEFTQLMCIELMMPSKHLILRHPILLLPLIFPSIRVFSNESDLHIRWTKYWSFSFNISPSNEHPGLISFKMDWLDLLAIQGTLKSFLQHHSSKASTCEMPGWLNYKIESRLLGKISTPWISRWYHHNGRNQRGTKELLDESERWE